MKTNATYGMTFLWTIASSTERILTSSRSHGEDYFINRTTTAMNQFTSSRPTTTGNGDLTADDFKKVFSPLDIFRLILTAITFVVTIAGNTAAIFYIYKNREWRSIKNYYYGYYLINLNVADLLVAVFCIPFTVIYYESKIWLFGSLFCRVMPTMQVISVSASIGTLTVITWERYRAIVYPMFPRSTMLGLRVKLGLIWAWAVAVGAPSFYANNLDVKRKLYQCMENWPKHSYRQGYTVFIFLVNYAIPLAFIFISYIVICVKLKRGKTPYGQNVSRMLQNKFIKLLIMLITSFAVCYLPTHVCFFMLDFGGSSSAATETHTFRTVITFAHLLTWINSCLNPFFYCAVGGFLKQQREQLRMSSKHSSTSLSGDSFRRSSNRGDENENELLFITSSQRTNGSTDKRHMQKNQPFIESIL
eukprot:gene15725-17310_t